MSEMAINKMAAPADDERRNRRLAAIDRAGRWLAALGMGWAVPVLRMLAGDKPARQMVELQRMLLIPLIGIGVFLAGWAFFAPQVQTSLGAIPGPVQVWEQAVVLWDEHWSERDKAAAFMERQQKRNDKLVAEGQAL